MTLKDKVVLVTGGTKGIGKACVLSFAKKGAKLIVNYAHDDAAAEALADELTGLKTEFLLAKADITNQSEVVILRPLR